MNKKVYSEELQSGDLRTKTMGKKTLAGGQWHDLRVKI